ncbi:Longin-like domain [Pseudocohnilembus persalinus]|uniref:Longin-like domain n=1 Tax=Pseudocohnilembus persalinus TaxID=266149 RepID=A0A0V0QBT6_PSEPJ|nr:Longin-like domain [Pseudocohnilembus persalinus]|eukprot:KRW99709.1 Longin-like domain [Pseudocohnilembus persalinus]
MSIIYTLIGKGQDIILVDYTNSFGNFAQITKNIMKKIETETSHSYMYNEKYYFHYINQAGVTYMCMTEIPFQQKLAITYLKDIKNMFQQEFSQNQINLAINYSLNAAFSNILKQKMAGDYREQKEASTWKQMKTKVGLGIIFTTGVVGYLVLG